MRVDDILFPILATCSLLVKKSLIHENSEVDRPRLCTLWGTVVLKAELKSKNIILTYVFHSPVRKLVAVYWLSSSGGTMFLKYCRINMGTIMKDLRQTGTTESCRERLKNVF